MVFQNHLISGNKQKLMRKITSQTCQKTKQELSSRERETKLYLEQKNQILYLEQIKQWLQSKINIDFRLS